MALEPVDFVHDPLNDDVFLPLVHEALEADDSDDAELDAYDEDWV